MHISKDILDLGWQSVSAINVNEQQAGSTSTEKLGESHFVSPCRLAMRACGIMTLRRTLFQRRRPAAGSLEKG